MFIKKKIKLEVESLKLSYKTEFIFARNYS